MKIGIIGAGKIAEKHLNAYRKLEGVSVVVSDISPSGEEIARRYGVDWDPNPESVLESTTVDAVDVCAPTEAHATTILTALGNEKDVFCEKPLASTAEEATTIQALGNQMGKVVMAGYLYRFHPAYQLAHDVLRNGVIGRPHFGLFRLGGRGSHRAWKHNRASGGGAAHEMFVHMLDLVLWYFGEPAKVETLWHETLLSQREIEGETIAPDVEDILAVRFTSTEGTEILIESDLATPSYMNYAELHGSNGSLMTSILDYFPTFVYCQEPVSVYDRGRNQFHFDFVDLFERELSHFVGVIRGEEDQRVNSVEDSIQVMRVLDQIGSEAARESR